MDDVKRTISRVGKRGFLYTYAYLEDRVRRKADRRMGEFKDIGRETLRHKLSNVAQEVHYKGLPEIAKELSYLMASLAGEPGKEILVAGSTGAAAYVSWNIAYYLGWMRDGDRGRKSRALRLKCREEWRKCVVGIPALVGVNARYEKLLLSHWKIGAVSDDSELNELRTRFGTEKWFSRLFPTSDKTI